MCACMVINRYIGKFSQTTPMEQRCGILFVPSESSVLCVQQNRPWWACQSNSTLEHSSTDSEPLWSVNSSIQARQQRDRSLFEVNVAIGLCYSKTRFLQRRSERHRLEHTERLKREHQMKKSGRCTPQKITKPFDSAWWFSTRSGVLVDNDSICHCLWSAHSIRQPLKIGLCSITENSVNQARRCKHSVDVHIPFSPIVFRVVCPGVIGQQACCISDRLNDAEQQNTAQETLQRDSLHSWRSCWLEPVTMRRSALVQMSY